MVSRIKPIHLLSAIIALALAMRIIGLDHQSLWLDEIYTMKMGDPANGVSDIYANSKTTDPLSVLYFTLIHYCFKVFGHTSIVARSFSVFFGLVGVWFVYLFGSRIRNQNTGLIAALLMAVSIFHIQYSQEARVYTMYSAATCFSFYHMYLFVLQPSRQRSIWYGLSTVWMLASHFFGLFGLAAQGIIVLYFLLTAESETRKRIFKFGLLSAGIIVVGFLPLVPILLIISKSTSSWIQPLTSREFVSLFDTFFGSSVLLVILAVIFLSVYLFSTFSNKENKEADTSSQIFVLLLGWIFVSFLIPYFMSFGKMPVLSHRYMISILPAVLLLLALGLDMIPNVRTRYVLLVFFVILSVTELTQVNNYYKHETKSDFRKVSRFAVENNVQGSVIVTSLPYHFDYYFRLFGNKAPVEGISLNMFIDAMRAGAKKKEAFWLIEGHGRSFDPTEENALFLDDNFEEMNSIQGFGSWTKYFVPRIHHDTTGQILSINSSNFFETKPYENDENLYLLNNGQIESKPYKLDRGVYRMFIRSQSQPGRAINGTSAHLDVLVNSKKVKSYFIDANSYLLGDSVDFEFEHHQDLVIGLKFDNDTMCPEGDRNAVIRKIIVNKLR